MFAVVFEAEWLAFAAIGVVVLAVVFWISALQDVLPDCDSASSGYIGSR